MYFYDHHVETGDNIVMTIFLVISNGKIPLRLLAYRYLPLVHTEFLIVKHQQTDRKENNNSDVDLKGIVLFHFMLSHFPIFSNVI